MNTPDPDAGADDAAPRAAPTYSLLVHEALVDGRFVVTNSSASRLEIPDGTLFDRLTAEQGTWNSDGRGQGDRCDLGPDVSLRLSGVDFFRRSVDRVPLGHHAAVGFEGHDVGELRAFLASHGGRWRVSLRANSKKA